MIDPQTGQTPFMNPDKGTFSLGVGLIMNAHKKQVRREKRVLLGVERWRDV